MLEVRPIGVPSEDSQDVMLYHYLGGLIFIGLERLMDAMDFFRMVSRMVFFGCANASCNVVVFFQCFVVPGSGMQPIQLAVFKKFILLSLIEKGTVDDLPTCVDGLHKQSLLNEAVKYIELGMEYASLDMYRLTIFAQSHKEEFVKV